MGKYTDLGSPPNAELEPLFPALTAMLGPAKGDASATEIRKMLASMPAPPADPKMPREYGVYYRNIPVAKDVSIELKFYIPHGGDNFVAEKRPIVFAMHGGGFVVGGYGIEEPLLQELCCGVGAVAVSVDYRMAPEYPFPTPVEDCFKALKWVSEHAEEFGGDRERIILEGTSAGGCLVAVMAQLARDHHIPGVIGQISLTPVTCHPSYFPKNKHEYTSYKENAEAPGLSAATMHWFWNQYISPPSANDPRASPLLAKSLRNLPPAFVSVAGLDPLRDEGLAYAEELKAAGVKTTVRVDRGCTHGFHALPGDFQVARDARKAVLTWVQGLVGESQKIAAKAVL